jgi:uncharacterized protein DUF4382
MGLEYSSRGSRTASALFLLCSCVLGAAGCNNTCVSGTLNGPGGSTVNVKAGDPPSCSLSTASGMVHLEIGAASGTTSTPFVITPLRPRVSHLYVTVAGVDAHSSPLAVDDTPGWQPLAAALQQHPVQLDLLADPQANASYAPFPEASLTAGAYRQIRLRLASALSGESALEAGRCGSGAPHCVIFSDGRVSPLAFPVSRPNLRIVLDGAPGHELYVPPDGAVALVIELDRDRTFLWPSGDSFLLAPVFHLRVQLPANVAKN